MAKGTYNIIESVVAYNNGDGLKFHKCEFPSSVDPLRVDSYNAYTTGTEYAGVNMNVGEVYEFAFRTFLMGVGTPGSGVLPHWDTLIKAAAFSETDSNESNTAGTFTYVAGNTNFTDDAVAGVCDPVDIVYNVDRRLWKTMTNCVADGAIRIETGQLPMIEFNFWGRVPSGHAVDTALVTKGADFDITPFRSESVTITFEEHADAYEGAATSTGTTTLTASAANFLNYGVQPGWIVTNTTDGSTGGGVVTAVTATTLTHTALTGGSGNDWQISDAFSVEPPASFTAADWDVRSIVLPFGNNCQHVPDIGEPNSYGDPRIIGRSGGVFYTFDINEPNRAAAYDWERAARAANGNDSRYYTVTIAINASGTAGNRFEISFDGKPTLKGGELSGSVGSYLRRMLLFEQMPDSGPLTISIT